MMFPLVFPSIIDRGCGVERTSEKSVSNFRPRLQAQEHDYRSFKEKMQQTLLSSVFVYFVFYKWEKALPLLMQGAMMPSRSASLENLRDTVLKR